MNAPEHRPALPWWLNPCLQVVFSALFVTISEVCLKIGANETAHVANSLEWLGVTSLGSGWVWIGVVSYIASFACWLHVLRHLPLNIAYNLACIEHVFIPLACAIFLGEKVGLLRWNGIALVLVGILIIAQPLLKMEERL